MGCTGTWHPEVLYQCTVIYPLLMTSCAQYNLIEQNMNGVYHFTPSKIASITDGTSNTLFYSEKANGLFVPSESLCFNWWGDGVSGDTLFDTLFPLNAFRKVKNVYVEYDYSWVEGPRATTRAAQLLIR